MTDLVRPEPYIGLSFLDAGQTTVGQAGRILERGAATFFSDGILSVRAFRAERSQEGELVWGETLSAALSAMSDCSFLSLYSSHVRPRTLGWSRIELTRARRRPLEVAK